jgi:hypothetical protein
MNLGLETWYVVDSVEFDNAALSIRMLPDYFNSELSVPVLEVSILGPLDELASRQSIARFKDEAVVDIQLSPTAIELWGEYDDVPTVVSGSSVSYARVPYSNDDLLKIVLSLKAQVGQWQAENAKLRASAREVDGFATELLRRAEAKKSITTRSATIEEAQIDVLQRVLNRIRGA